MYSSVEVGDNVGTVEVTDIIQDTDLTLPRNYIQVTSATISDVSSAENAAPTHELIADPNNQTTIVAEAFASPGTSQIVRDGDGTGIALDARCLVCNDKASGLHYGVLACEGCKVSASLPKRT